MIKYLTMLLLLVSMSVFSATNSMSMNWSTPTMYVDGSALLPTDIDRYEITITAPDETVQVVEVLGGINNLDQDLTGGEGVYRISIRVKDKKYELWSDPIEVTLLIEDKVDNSATKIHFNIKIEITHNG